MYEDKVKICKLLCAMLRETRDLHDLVELGYDSDKELVYAKYSKGMVININVAMDSGTAMISDIMREIC